MSATRLDGPDGQIAAFKLSDAGDDAPPVVAVHGITSSSRNWVAVARELDGRVTLVAVDLRGRGASAGLPGPYGLAAHERDVLELLDALELERAVLAGHSLGAYVVARVAAAHPERVSAAVLVDGGLPLPGTENADPDALLDAFLGPALARLKMRFDTREAYRDFWRAHPALIRGDVDDADIVAYADYDLVGEEPELRSSVSEDAVRADGADLFRAGADAGALRMPATLLVAPRGLLDDPHPIHPAALAREWEAGGPELRRLIEVPDVNHYTIALGAHGSRSVADAIAEAAAT